MRVISLDLAAERVGCQIVDLFYAFYSGQLELVPMEERTIKRWVVEPEKVDEWHRKYWKNGDEILYEQ